MFDLETIEQLSTMNADALEKAAADLEKDTFGFLEQIQEHRAKPTAVQDWRTLNRKEIFLYYSHCHAISDVLRPMQPKTASAILDSGSGLLANNLYRFLLPRLVQGLEGNGGFLMDQVLSDIPDKDKLNKELAECLREKLEQESADSVKAVLIACLSCVSDSGPWSCLRPALEDYRRAVLVHIFNLSFQDKFLEDLSKAVSTCSKFRSDVRSNMIKPTKASEEFCSKLREQFVWGLNGKIKDNWGRISPQMCRQVPIRYLDKGNLTHFIRYVVPGYLANVFSGPELPKDAVVLVWLVLAIFEATEITEADKRAFGLELGRLFEDCLCRWFQKTSVDNPPLDSFCDVLGDLVLMKGRYSLPVDHWILEVKRSGYSVLRYVGFQLVERALKRRPFGVFEMVLGWLEIGKEPLYGSRRRIKMEILFKAIGGWTTKLPEILRKNRSERDWKTVFEIDARGPNGILASQQKGVYGGVSPLSSSELTMILAWPAAVALWITQDVRPWERIVNEDVRAWPLAALQEAMGVADLRATLLLDRKMDELRR